MKRASYRRAVEHIALNDDPGQLSVPVIMTTLTVGLVADLFGVEVLKVARSVAKFRRKEARASVGSALGSAGHGGRQRLPRGADRVVSLSPPVPAGSTEPIGTVGGVEIVAPSGRVALADPAGTHPACTSCASAIMTDGPAPAEGTQRTCRKCGRVWTFEASHGHGPPPGLSAKQQEKWRTMGAGAGGGRTLVWRCPKRVS